MGSLILRLKVRVLDQAEYVPKRIRDGGDPDAASHLLHPFALPGTQVNRPGFAGGQFT